MAVTEGWPDITDDLADVDFLLLQGEEEDARKIVAELRKKYPGHPELVGVLPDGEEPAEAAPDEETTLPVASAPVEAPPPKPAPQVIATIASALADPPPVDRTLVTHGLQAPKPFVGEPPPSFAAKPPVASAPTNGAGKRNTVVPETRDRPAPPRPFDGGPPPGSTLVPGTIPPSGGFPRLAPAMFVEEAVQSHVRTAPHRVVDAPPPALPRTAEVDFEIPVLPTAFDDDDSAALGATPVVDAPRPAPPAKPARLIMLGDRGQSVAERRIDPFEVLEVGRDTSDPWSDDAFLEPRHARIRAAAAGVVFEALGGPNGVFLRLEERTKIADGDEFRVGQSLIRYHRRSGPTTGTTGAAGPWGLLRVVEGFDGPVREHPVSGAGLIVGRERGDIVLPEDTYVSGEHCRIFCEGDALYIEDSGSSNGTYVRVAPGQVLPFGALVLMGQTQFRIRPV